MFNIPTARTRRPLLHKYDVGFIRGMRYDVGFLGVDLGVAAPFPMALVTTELAAEPSLEPVDAAVPAVAAAVEPSMPKVSTALAMRLYRNGGSTVLATASEVWAPALAAALVVSAPASTIFARSFVTSCGPGVVRPPVGRMVGLGEHQGGAACGWGERWSAASE